MGMLLGSVPSNIPTRSKLSARDPLKGHQGVVVFFDFLSPETHSQHSQLQARGLLSSACRPLADMSFRTRDDRTRCAPVKDGDPSFVFILQACHQISDEDVINSLGMPMREVVSPFLQAP